MIYDELEIFPNTTEIQTRIIIFWSKLIENSVASKLSSTVYNTVNNMHENRHLKETFRKSHKQKLQPAPDTRRKRKSDTD